MTDTPSDPVPATVSVEADRARKDALETLHLWRAGVKNVGGSGPRGELLAEDVLAALSRPTATESPAPSEGDAELVRRLKEASENARSTYDSRACGWHRHELRHALRRLADEVDWAVNSLSATPSTPEETGR